MSLGIVYQEISLELVRGAIEKKDNLEGLGDMDRCPNPLSWGHLGVLEMV